MSGLIPDRVINTVKTFNDLGVSLYGIECTLFVPTNLTELEPEDIYTSPDDITYKQYGCDDVKIWIEWFVSNVHRLRKLGIFAEGETPIIARFENYPEVIVGSYVKIKTEYIPDCYNLDTDGFEVVDVLMKNTYNQEVYRYYKMAPRRKKNT